MSEIALILSAIGVAGGLIFGAYELMNLNKIRRMEFLDKMVIRFLDYHNKFSKKKPNPVDRENYLNFFEYLCFLILKNRIDETDSRDLFKDLLFEIHKRMRPDEIELRDNFSDLVEKWKI